MPDGSGWRPGQTRLQEAVASFRRSLAGAMYRSGYGKKGSIPADMTFIRWVQELQAAGLKVDRKPFRLESRRALVELYRAIPTTPEEAQRRTLVVRKGAQLGMTVWEMLANLYMALKFEPAVIGMFMPSQPLAADKSKRRFMNIVRSIPDLHRRLINAVPDPSGSIVRAVGEGNILTRELGDSALLFLWTSGAVTTESRPMDIVTYDEVQGMTLEEIDRTDERMSASEIRFKLMLSTANEQDQDIDNWYKRGTQEAFHTQCFTCNSLNDLSAKFLDENGVRVVKYNTGELRPIRCDGVEIVPPHNEFCYVCPDCQGYIHDSEIGRYVAGMPDRIGGLIRSLHVSQLTSPTITPRDIATAWGHAETGSQRKSFFNRKLGLPHTDPNEVPVTLEHCLKAVEAGRSAGVKWKTSGYDTVMGIDQMGGFNAVIIKERLRDGRQALIHAEAIFDLQPFDRCTELMKTYGVSKCVVEQLPNVNDARAFANREGHRNRVYLAGYTGDAKADMIAWGDQISQNDIKTAVDDRSRYMVTLQQYKAMEAALYRVRNTQCLFPDPALLEQEVIDKGERKRILLLRDWVFLHLTRVKLVVEGNDPDDEAQERKPVPKVKKMGIDPHFAFANMLCDVAWSRVHGSSVMIPEDPSAETAAKMQEEMPGLPKEVTNLIRHVEGTCGSCANFKHGQCFAHGFMVKARDPACAVYEPADE